MEQRKIETISPENDTFLTNANSSYEKTDDEILGIMESNRLVMGVDICVIFLCEDRTVNTLKIYSCSQKGAEIILQDQLFPQIHRIIDKLGNEIKIESKMGNELLELVSTEEFRWAIVRRLQKDSGEVYGFIVMGNKVRRLYILRDELLINNLDKTISLVIEKQLRQIHLKKVNKDFNALIQIGKVLASKPRLEDVLAQIISVLGDLLDVESGGFQLFNPETQELALQKPSFGITDNEMIALCHPTLKEGGLAVEVFLQGEPYICNEVHTDPRVNQNYCRLYGVRNMLSVPLVFEGQGIGVLLVINKKNGCFTQDDIQVLMSIGSQLSMVIRNACLFEEAKNNQMESIALYQVATEISSLVSLEQILNSVVQKVRYLLRCDITGISLLDNQRRTGVMAATASDKSNSFRGLAIDSSRGITAEVINTKKPVIWTAGEDLGNRYVFDELDLITRSKEFKTLVAVPLQNANNVVGVLYVWRRNAIPFLTGEIDLLYRFSRQASVAIENARLYEQEQKTVAKLKDFNQLIESQHALLKRSSSIHQQLTQMVLEDKGIEAITLTLAGLLKASVAVTDKFCRLLHSAQFGINQKLEFEKHHKLFPPQFVNNPRIKEFFEQLLKERRPMDLPLVPDFNTLGPHVITPILVGHQTLGYVSIARSSHELEELDYVAIEHAATVYALEMMKQKIADEVTSKLKGDCVDDLLNGHFKSDEEILMRANFLGYNINLPYQVIIIDIDNFSDFVNQKSVNEKKVAKVKSSLFNLVNNTVMDRSPRSMVISKSDKIVIIADAVPPKNSSRNYLNPNDLAHRLKVKITETLHEITISVGIGTVTRQLKDFQNSYQEAMLVLKIMNKFDKRNVLMNFGEIGVYGLLFQIESKEQLEAYHHRILGKLVSYDKKNGTPLLTTLEAFIKNNCNLQKTSKSAYLHINTLNYRLRRVQEITGIDLDSAEERLNVQMALKIKDLLQ